MSVIRVNHLFVESVDATYCQTRDSESVIQDVAVEFLIYRQFIEHQAHGNFDQFGVGSFGFLVVNGISPTSRPMQFKRQS